MNNKGILILLVVPVFIGFLIGKKMKEHQEVQIKQQVVASQPSIAKPAIPNQVNHSNNTVLAPDTDNLKPPEDVKQQSTTTMQNVNKQDTNNNSENNNSKEEKIDTSKEKIDTGTSTINENKKDANKDTADNKCECKEDKKEDKKRVIRKAVDEEIKKVKEKEKRKENKEEKEENKENKEKNANDQVVLSNIKSMSVVCKLNQECYLTDGVKQYRKGDNIGGYTIDSIGILGVDLTDKKGNKVRVSL